MTNLPFPFDGAATDEAASRSPKVVIYSTDYCPYCVRAERLLEQKAIRFERVAVDDDRETREWLAKVTGQRTVPQIFIHGRSVGGFTELAALARSGRLDALLDQAAAE